MSFSFCTLCIFSLWTAVPVFCDVIGAPILFYRQRSILNGFQCALPLLFGKFTLLLLHLHRSCSSQESFPAKVFFSKPGCFSSLECNPRNNIFHVWEETVLERASSRQGLFLAMNFSQAEAFQHSTVSGLTLTFHFVGNLNQNRRICWHLQTPFETFHAFGVWGTSLFGARGCLLVVQYWVDSERPFCFTCCFAVFAVSLLCFQEA